MLGSGFKIGTSGKKYGLIQPAAPKPNVPSIFSAEDDEPKSMQQALKEEAIRKNKLQRVSPHFYITIPLSLILF